MSNALHQLRGHIRQDGSLGFSMIEVVLAMGITVFCLAAILGLISVGLQSHKDTIEETDALTLAVSICNDLRDTSPGAISQAYKITLPLSDQTSPSTQEMTFSRTGKLGAGSGAFFVANVSITPPGNSHQPYVSRVLLQWPQAAQKKNRSGKLELLDAFSVQ